MNGHTESIFDKVLTVGPDINGRGGIASVLQTYRRTLPAFRFMASNSRRGTVAGAFALAALMARLPLAKWFGGYSIVHIHGASGKSFVRKSWIIKWASALGYKVVYHVHGGGFKDYAAEVGYDRIKSTLARCTAVIALSPMWKRFFVEELGFENTVALENMIEAPSASVSYVRRGGEPVRFLFLGKVCREKGVFDMLRALKENAAALIGRMKLYIGGNGMVGELKAAIADYGLCETVEFVGWVDGDRKARMLSESDVLVLPSYIEGLSITILEAMACGKPVVATPVGAVPELVQNGENGTLVAPGDVSGLGSAFRRYVENPDLIASEGNASRGRIEPYLPGSVQRKLTAIYSNVLAL